MNEPRIVHVGANEQEIAAKHKAGIEAKLREVCALIDAAKADGMVVQFNLTADAFGRQKVDTLQLIKLLA